jgi:gliding motility-associated-like protein
MLRFVYVSFSVLVGILLMSTSAAVFAQQSRNCDTLGRYVLHGAAADSAPNMYRITKRGVPGSFASMWNTDALRLDYDFDLKFKIKQCGTADGVVLVFHQSGTTAHAATTGGSLNYFGSPLYSRSLALELDIYDNSATFNDLDNSHIALTKNAVSTPIAGPFVVAPSLRNCQDRILYLEWSASSQELIVLLDNVVVLTFNEDIVRTIFNGNPSVTFGFVGSTGAETATQVIQPMALHYYAAPLVITALGPIRYCDPDSVRLRVPLAEAGSTYLWTPNTGLSATTTNTVTAHPPRPIIYQVRVTTPAGCVRTDTIQVTPIPPFTVSAGDDLQICPGKSARLGVLNPARDVTYTWQPAEALVDTVGNEVIGTPIALVTDYIVRARTRGGCDGYDTVQVTFRPPLRPDLGPAQTLCPGVSATLDPGIFANNPSYVWSPEEGLSSTRDTAVQATPSIPTRYTVVVTDTLGCTGRASIQINPVAPLGATASSETLDLARRVGFTATFLQGSPNRYLWFFGDGAIDSTAAPIHMYPRAGEWDAKLVVTFGPDCQEEVLLKPVAQQFQLPNVLTPDGDNRNESFRINVSKTKVDLEIYNRYGRLVYEKKDYRDGWGSAETLAGVYFYKLKDETGQVWKGWVEVVK